MAFSHIISIPFQSSVFHRIIHTVVVTVNFNGAYTHGNKQDLQ